MLTPTRRLALAAASIFLAACASASSSSGRGSGASEIVMYFVNNSIHQANVYALTTGGSSVRVGTVFPGRRERLNLPATVLGGTRTIELEARLLTSQNVSRSGSITLSPADTLEAQLSSDGMLLSVLPLRGGR